MAPTTRPLSNITTRAPGGDVSAWTIATLMAVPITIMGDG